MPLTAWWHDFLDLIFPRACLGCGQTDTWLCSLCLAQIQICGAKEQVCPVCKKPSFGGQVCQNCRDQSFLDGVLAASHFKGTLLQKILHTYKYQFVSDLKQPLGEILKRALREWQEKLPEKHPVCQNEILIIPIPLHKSRLKWRGFNQSELLAREIASNNWILDTTSLTRHQKTLAQAHLDKAARAANLTQAFVCTQPEKIKNKNIFLVDDVFTTGATLQAAAQVLKSAGAREVWGLVIAHE